MDLILWRCTTVKCIIILVMDVRWNLEVYKILNVTHISNLTSPPVSPDVFCIHLIRFRLTIQWVFSTPTRTASYPGQILPCMQYKTWQLTGKKLGFN